jgi:hypothetical protein
MRNEKSRNFCLMFMNSMEDGRENPGSRPWTFFDDYEYQLRKDLEWDL